VEPDKREPEWVVCPECDGDGGWWGGEFNSEFNVCRTCDGMDGWWKDEERPLPPPPNADAGEGT